MTGTPGSSKDDRKMEFMRRVAENYERHFVPTIGAPVAADLVEAASLRPGERVLDAACGTGVVTKLAAERVAPGGTVVGLDPNPAMLGVARATTPADLSIDWHQAAAEELPFPDESFDAVLCGMGLQFFSDREAGLREFHRVLVRGGRLVANVPGPAPPPFEILAAALARHIGPESASFVSAVFSLRDPGDLRDLAASAGFEDADVLSGVTPLTLPAPREFLWQYVWSTPLAAAVAQASDERRIALEREFTENCRPLAAAGTLAGGVSMMTLIAAKQSDGD
jgi:ubiquinone/menaquinone biosynthesis C-methylase UbiE